MKFENLEEGKPVNVLKIKIIGRSDVFEFGDKKMLKLDIENSDIKLIFWNEDLKIAEKIKDGNEITIIEGFCKRYTNKDYDEKQIIFGRYASIKIGDKIYEKKNNKWG